MPESAFWSGLQANMPPALRYFLSFADVIKAINMEVLDYDVVVLGSGIAGFKAALHAAEKTKGQRICIISKLHAMRSHSVSAEGGISGVLSPEEGKDSEDSHAFDTIKGSDYLADQDAVELLVSRAPGEIRHLEHLGVPWNRTVHGEIEERPFGGMSTPRTAFAADKTGFFMMRALYDYVSGVEGIDIFHEYYATSIVIEKGTFGGICAFRISDGEEFFFRGRSGIIATGGFSRAYGFTTTAHSSTGDGTALAFEAGLALKDMEFVQYHPTALVPSGILISEAARGEGAYLINANGERFMSRYAKERMELAPRDIISRAIMTEINEGRGFPSDRYGYAYVGLDLRHIDMEKLSKKLPMIMEMSKRMIKLDPGSEPIPVRPGTHFTMGGVHTDIDGNALYSDGRQVAGLWAVGECGCVSVHGANRLGSNSLSQCAVWGRIAGEKASEHAAKSSFHSRSHPEEILERESGRIGKLRDSSGSKNPYEIRSAMQKVMDSNFFVFKTVKGMEEGVSKLLEIKKEFSDIYVTDKGKKFNTNLVNIFEIGNLLELAHASAELALRRRESRGSHFVMEYRERDDAEWLKHSIISKRGARHEISYLPVRITRWKPQPRVY